MRLAPQSSSFRARTSNVSLRVACPTKGGFPETVASSLARLVPASCQVRSLRLVIQAWSDQNSGFCSMAEASSRAAWAASRSSSLTKHNARPSARYGVATSWSRSGIAVSLGSSPFSGTRPTREQEGRTSWRWSTSDRAADGTAGGWSSPGRPASSLKPPHRPDAPWRTTGIEAGRPIDILSAERTMTASARLTVV